MIRALYLIKDKGVFKALNKFSGNNEIVNPPTDISFSGSGSKTPPRILNFIGIKIAERI
jgi:hypothetical protein